MIQLWPKILGARQKEINKESDDGERSVRRHFIRK